MKIIAAVLSYKMLELTDKTVEHLVRGGFKHGEDLFVFENQGSGPNNSHQVIGGTCSKYVTHFTGDNLRMTGGFNYICDTIAEWKEQPDVVWLCTNDFDVLQTRVLHDGRPIVDLIEQAFEYPGARGFEKAMGWWHPSLEVIPNYAYPWMFTREERPWIRDAWMTDFICPAVNWNIMQFLREKQGYWFDPRFYRGWGIDYETCYLIRKHGMAVRVDDRIQIRHEASKTYDSGAAPETRGQFYNMALDEMHQVMKRKYGPNWFRLMQEGR